MKLMHNHTFLSLRSQVLQQQRGRLQRDSQCDQVGPSVSAVELPVPSQPHLPGCPLPGAERRTLVLPQPWEQTWGPLVLHAGRGGPHGALWHTHLWWERRLYIYVFTNEIHRVQWCLTHILDFFSWIFKKVRMMIMFNDLPVLHCKLYNTFFQCSLFAL